MNEEIEFLPEHLIGFDDIEGRLCKVDVLHEGAFHKRMGPSVSFKIDGVIVGCGGIHLHWKGAGESWMCLRASTMGPSVLKFARDWLNRTIEKYAFDRVQAIIPIGNQWARTEKFLGFSLETYLRKYGPNGKDMALWARVRL
jgi:hypothetical protein